MTLAGFHSRNHPQQTAKRGPNPLVDDRGTDPALFMELDARFHFTIDVAASKQNAKCERYYTIDDDGLAQSWAAERVWCNPPYSNIEPWIAKAHTSDAELVVMLLPANRTEQGWWQRQVEPYRDRGRSSATGRVFRVEFLAGRPRFVNPEKPWIGPNERPPFGCCLLIWDVS